MTSRSRDASPPIPAAKPVRVLLIDDEANTLLPPLAQALEPMGFEFHKESSGAQALQSVASISPDVILLDLHFPGDDHSKDGRTTGGRLLTEIRQQFESIPIVVFTTRLDDVDIPLETFDEQFDGCFAKPDFRSDKQWVPALARAMRDAIEMASTDRNPDADDLGFLAGLGKEMRMATGKIRTAARNDLTVLIYGETGTGKQLAAEAIHKLSGRTGRFEHYNCSGAHPETLDSKLFGHEKGAFTGAHAATPGLFELADKGTLFLDEIQGMPIELQNKLMTVIENGLVRRMGATADKQVDVRLIVATNHNLSDLAAEGVLRVDLAYRFAQFPIHLPPLRQRMADLSEFFRFFVNSANAKLGKSVLNLLRPETRDKLLAHSWPGNIRELESTILRAVANTRSSVLLPGDIEFVHIARRESEGLAHNSQEPATTSAPAPSDVVAPSVPPAFFLTDLLETKPIAERYDFLKNQRDVNLRREILSEFICRLRRRAGERVTHKILAAELDPLTNGFKDLDKIRQFLSESGVRITRM